MTFTIFTLVTKEYKNIGLEITEQTLHLEIRVIIYKSLSELFISISANTIFNIWPQQSCNFNKGPKYVVQEGNSKF